MREVNIDASLVKQGGFSQADEKLVKMLFAHLENL